MTVMSCQRDRLWDEAALRYELVLLLLLQYSHLLYCHQSRQKRIVV